MNRTHPLTTYKIQKHSPLRKISNMKIINELVTIGIENTHKDNINHNKYKYINSTNIDNNKQNNIGGKFFAIVEHPGNFIFYFINSYLFIYVIFKIIFRYKYSI